MKKRDQWERKGIARPAVPLFRLRTPEVPAAGWVPNWPNMRFRKAEALIRRELAGVGQAASLWICGRWELHDAARLRGMAPHEVVGLSGRVRLTPDEAAACLPPPVLAQFTAIRVDVGGETGFKPKESA